MWRGCDCRQATARLALGLALLQAVPKQALFKSGMTTRPERDPGRVLGLMSTGLRSFPDARYGHCGCDSLHRMEGLSRGFRVVSHVMTYDFATLEMHTDDFARRLWRETQSSV